MMGSGQKKLFIFQIRLLIIITIVGSFDPLRISTDQILTTEELPIHSAQAYAGGIRFQI
jgi:hypothetical protein